MEEPPALRVCGFPGCEFPYNAKGYCRAHYEQHRNGVKLRAINAQYLDESGTCAAPDCTNTFRRRTIGSERRFCSRKCSNRTRIREKRADGWVPAHRRPGRESCSVLECEKPRYVHGYCIMHAERVRRFGTPGEAERRKAAPGTADWTQTSDGYMRRSFNGEIQLQHRVVMEELLGRLLWADETVHHKNGNRSDNRPENLELWSSWQPAGQRVEDKIAYAREILARYAPIKKEVT